jgi:hypothetical protein
MKQLMIIGGTLGFATSLGLGLMQEVSWPAALWRSSLVALLSGLLFRWWGRLCIRCLKYEHARRQAEEEAAADNPPPAKGAKS